MYPHKSDEHPYGADVRSSGLLWLSEPLPVSERYARSLEEHFVLNPKSMSFHTQWWQKTIIRNSAFAGDLEVERYACGIREGKCELKVPLNDLLNSGEEDKECSGHDAV